jgi:RNA polymerase sigma-70 factor, ECF subfamily
MEKDDEQLISEYLDGDECALENLIRRKLKLVYNFAYRLTNNIQDAEDITQETFVKVWRNIKKYRHGENVQAWIFAIARNTAVDILRKRKTLTFSDFEDESGENAILNTLPDPAPLPDEIFAKIEKKDFIDNILKNIPFIYKEVLLLYYAEQLSLEEIAKTLKISVNTIKTRHRRGIVYLRKLLDAPKIGDQS